MLFDALCSLTGLLPKPVTDKNDKQTATMGICGADNNTNLMQPCWKGDKSADPAFKAQLDQYTKAQRLLEQHKLSEAETALAAFVAQHPDSELVPNARFALSLAYAGQGQNAQGRTAMEQFAKDYPKHPLADDARKVASALK